MKTKTKPALKDFEATTRLVAVDDGVWDQGLCNRRSDGFAIFEANLSLLIMKNIELLLRFTWLWIWNFGKKLENAVKRSLIPVFPDLIFLRFAFEWMVLQKI